MEPEVSLPRSQYPPPVRILSQPNPVRHIDLYLRKVHLNVIRHLCVGLPSVLLPSALPTKTL